MRSRPVPASLWWVLALLIASVGVAIAAGAILYLQTTHATKTQAEAISRGDASRGKSAIARYGCAGCHVIPGISGANGIVGPDLSKVSERTTIAGKLSNDPDTMVRWLLHPQALVPGNGMPEQGITEREARDIAAYLYAKS